MIRKPTYGALSDNELARIRNKAGGATKQQRILNAQRQEKVAKKKNAPKPYPYYGK